MEWKPDSSHAPNDWLRSSHRRRRRMWATVVVGCLTLTAVAGSGAAYAYAPTAATLYAPTAAETAQINKTNAVLYPKAAVLPNGRLVAAIEKSIGNPVGQTMPLFKSDDSGTTWQPLGTVASPAVLTEGTSREAEFAKYTSNWTTPYLYTLTQDLGDLEAGTLLLASLVSGQDEFYAEQKAEDPDWMPSRDGDRRDLAIALYASTDGNGESWQFLNLIAQGGWSGSYGDASAISDANTANQVDPVWEPFLMEYDGQLVAYYTDEVDYTGFDSETGVLQRDPDWQTAPDTVNQILAHKTWDGRSSSDWSAPVADEVGNVTIDSTGTSILGGGRPGMTNVVPTTDGKWIFTAEFGVTKISDDPLRFWDKPNVDLTGNGLNPSGQPVHIVIPDPVDPSKWRLAFNSASTGGEIYVNESGASTGTWVPFRTSLANGYSRNLTYVPETGRVVILRSSFGVANPIEFGEVDLGNSEGTYYQLVNRKTGDVLGTGGSSQDSDFSGQFVMTEAAGSSSLSDTQSWHLTPKANDTVTLLNKAGGRALGIWLGSTSAGARLAQWNDDNNTDKLWKTVDAGDGYIRLQSAGNTALYVTAGDRGTTVTTQAATTDGSQEWLLVAQDTTPEDASEQTIEVTVPDSGPGEFSWRIDSSSTLVDLGTATTSGDHYAASGEIQPIRVTDTRTTGSAWSVSAQVSDFTSSSSSVSAKYLGWVPNILETGGGAVAGVSVQSGFIAGYGLSVSQTLGYAAAGHEIGSTRLGADLDLMLPADVTDGTYTATLTLTALG